jgi:8-oxo-dGTP pyrophosphatase MutT (NUDIX family)
MLKNVCAFYETSRGVLAVERRKKPGMFGLVGGKIEPGESPEAALLREAPEETGLDFTGVEVTLLYTATDETGDETATYRISGLSEVSLTKLEEDYVGPEGSRVMMVPWSVLTESHTCEFPGYNAAVQEAARAAA